MSKAILYLGIAVAVCLTGVSWWLLSGGNDKPPATQPAVQAVDLPKVAGSKSMPPREFLVEKMHCEACAQSVAAAIRKIPGIRSVEVSFARKRAHVVADPSRAPDEKILAAIREAGYDGRIAPAPAPGTAPDKHASCELAKTGKCLMIQPIGKIHSPYKEEKGTPIQGVFSKDAEACAELDSKYALGLRDLDGFSHAILLYQFHLSDKVEILSKPYLEDREHGIFAIRSPHRPNHIGYSIVRIKRVDGNRLYFTEVDILDGAPLLDIKPYVKEFDSRSDAKSGWIARHFQDGDTPKHTTAH